MIDDTDQLLMEWLRGVLPDTAVTLAPPTAETPEGVNLYLLDLAMEPPLRGAHRPPLQFTLNYLVTTWSPDASNAHRLLGDVVCAAAVAPGFEVVNVESRVDWRAFGVSPRPAFLLKVTAQVVQPEPVSPMVREPLVLHAVPMLQMAGRVLGPGHKPVANARIESPGLDRTVHTNAAGWFTMPAGAGPQSLMVTVKGRRFAVVSPGPQDTTPFIIHFDPTEV